jgi:hypothetical protein
MYAVVLSVTMTLSALRTLSFSRGVSPIACTLTAEAPVVQEGAHALDRMSSS